MLSNPVINSKLHVLGGIGLRSCSIQLQKDVLLLTANLINMIEWTRVTLLQFRVGINIGVGYTNIHTTMYEHAPMHNMMH